MHNPHPAHRNNRATGKHTVTYDDGDLRDYDMHSKEYQLLALPPARRCVVVGIAYLPRYSCDAQLPPGRGFRAENQPNQSPSRQAPTAPPTRGATQVILLHHRRR